MWNEITMLFLILVPSVVILDGEVTRKKDHKSWWQVHWFWISGAPLTKQNSWVVSFMGTLAGQSPSWRETPPYSGLLRVADLSRSPSYLVLATAIFCHLSRPLPPLSILQEEEIVI